MRSVWHGEDDQQILRCSPYCEIDEYLLWQEKHADYHGHADYHEQP